MRPTVAVEEWRAAHFYDLVEALVSHHPHVRFAVVAAEEEHLHGDAQQLLELGRSSDPRDTKSRRKHGRSEWSQYTHTLSPKHISNSDPHLCTLHLTQHTIMYALYREDIIQ